MRVLVTGASGFVGGPVCRALVKAGLDVAGASRRPAVLPAAGLPAAGPSGAVLPAAGLPDGVRAVAVGDLGPDTDWGRALAGIDAVVHLAARAHVMDETEADPLAVFRRVNRDGTLRLAEQAAHAGVRRLVFVSSIKVLGEADHCGRSFTAGDVPAPVDPYGIAKAEAEAGLAALAARTGLEVVVLRPPLVHGPGAKGNLAALMRMLAKRVPLPLGRIANRRSLVGVANLADAIRFLLATPEVAGGIFLVKDGEDVSTPELLRRLGRAMGREPVLLPVPPALLSIGLRLIGRQAAYQRLAGSLTLDDSPLRALGWSPVESLDEGLRAMAAARLAGTGLAGTGLAGA